MKTEVTLLEEAGPEVEKARRKQGRRHNKSFYESTIRKIKREIEQNISKPQWKNSRAHTRLLNRLERFETEYKDFKRQYAIAKRKQR